MVGAGEEEGEEGGDHLEEEEEVGGGAEGAVEGDQDFIVVVDPRIGPKIVPPRVAGTYYAGGYLSLSLRACGPVCRLYVWRAFPLGRVFVRSVSVDELSRRDYVWISLVLGVVVVKSL